jgi:hypothetical protein
MNTARSLRHQRCYHHAAREAAARCPECQRFFCRECVSEHDDRVLCSSCLARLNKPSMGVRLRLAGLINVLRAVVAIIVAWSVLYGLGRALLHIPGMFHHSAPWY